MGKDVVIYAPVAYAFQRAPEEFRGDPNEVERAVIRAKYQNLLPSDFWIMQHVCPLCKLTLDAYTFIAHAQGCIKERAPRGQIWIPGFNPEVKNAS